VSVQPQPAAIGLRCLDPRCGTVLGADAEVCDECGGSALAPIDAVPALLLGDAGDRPVAFALHPERPNILGRSSPGTKPLDIDVTRFRGSESVHRRHAQFDERQGHWTITHLGRNPIVLLRPEGTVVVEPGSSSALRSGDWLQIGRIRLRLVVDPANGI
jgi:FHA domain